MPLEKTADRNGQQTLKNRPKKWSLKLKTVTAPPSFNVNVLAKGSKPSNNPKMSRYAPEIAT